MSDELGHLSDREILLLVHSDVANIKSRINDHAGRIRVLERGAVFISGAASVIGSIIGYIRIKGTHS